MKKLTIFNQKGGVGKSENVNSGHYKQVDEAQEEFGILARETIRRTGI